jgi:hypothetical protein
MFTEFAFGRIFSTILTGNDSLHHLKGLRYTNRQGLINVSFQFLFDWIGSNSEGSKKIIHHLML